MSPVANLTQEILIKPATCNGLSDPPNAWGHQEYSGEFLKISIDRQKDVNNNLDRYGTLRGFVIRHVEGIKLKAAQKVNYCKNCTCQSA